MSALCVCGGTKTPECRNKRLQTLMWAAPKEKQGVTGRLMEVSKSSARINNWSFDKVYLINFSLLRIYGRFARSRWLNCQVKRCCCSFSNSLWARANHPSLADARDFSHISRHLKNVIRTEITPKKWNESGSRGDFINSSCGSEWLAHQLYRLQVLSLSRSLTFNALQEQEMHI